MQSTTIDFNVFAFLQSSNENRYRQHFAWNLHIIYRFCQKLLVWKNHLIKQNLFSSEKICHFSLILCFQVNIFGYWTVGRNKKRRHLWTVRDIFQYILIFYTLKGLTNWFCYNSIFIHCSFHMKFKCTLLFNWTSGLINMMLKHEKHIVLRYILRDIFWKNIELSILL